MPFQGPVDGDSGLAAGLVKSVRSADVDSPRFMGAILIRGANWVVLPNLLIWFGRTSERSDG